MTAKMKQFLHDHGITATDVARHAGVRYYDMYKMLRGEKKPEPSLRDAFIRIFGMTEAEWKEAVP